MSDSSNDELVQTSDQCKRRTSTNVGQFKRRTSTNVGQFKRRTSTNVGQFKHRTSTNVRPVQTSELEKILLTFRRIFKNPLFSLSKIRNLTESEDLSSILALILKKIKWFN